MSISPTSTIAGNVTGDPELRHTPNGKSVLKFNVAHNPRRFNSVTSQWENGDPHFFEVEAWGRVAETAALSVGKGHRVVVVGRLDYQTWESDGQKRSKHVVVAEEIAMSTLFSQWRGDRIAAGQQGVAPVQQGNQATWGGNPNRQQPQQQSFPQQQQDPWNSTPQQGGFAPQDDQPPF